MSWITGYQKWLSESESLKNAQLVINHFKDSWSKESIAALCGNMRHESSLNPDMYEYGYSWDSDRGYGLVQWTPRSKFWNWATSKNLPPRNGNSQLARIDYEVEENIQWIPRSDYGNMTFKQFRENSGNWSVDYLTEAFTWGYERPNQNAGWNSMPARKAFANKVFNELDWDKDPDPDPDPEPDPDPNIPWQNILNKIKNGLDEGIKDLLTPNLYTNSKDFYSNNLLVVQQISDKMLKIKITKTFSELFNDLWKNIIDNIDPVSPPNPNPDPDPEPEPGKSKPAFPTTEGLRLSSPYGWRVHPITGLPKFHTGTDWSGGGATHPIFAVQKAKVTLSRFSDTGGWMVYLEHIDDQYHSRYLHLHEKPLVVVGDTVEKGERIGTMGTTGSSTGIHLHLEIATSQSGFGTENGTINPVKYLDMYF